MISRAAVAGIRNFWLCGFEPDDWDKQIQFKKEMAGQARIVTSFGLHPWWVAERISHHARQSLHSQTEAFTPSALPPTLTQALADLEARIPQADALGELGLDYHPRHFQTLGDAGSFELQAGFQDEGTLKTSAQELQAEVFRRQLDMARQHQKPLVLHIVRAHPKAIRVLRESGKTAAPFGGIVHSFGGDLATARKYLAMGLTLSISASIFKDAPAAEKAQKTAAALDLTDFVLETDTPDQFVKLPPADPSLAGATLPHDKILNEPAQILRIATAVAKIKSTTAQKVLEASSQNLLRILHL